MPPDWPPCKNCMKLKRDHVTIYEVCPDQKGRKTFETHYQPIDPDPDPPAAA